MDSQSFRTNDPERYGKHMMRKEEEYELLCKRCGECCGSCDDPCENLKAEDTSGKFVCKDYNNRLGPKKTVSGASFNCVPISEHVRNMTLRPGCSYRVLLRSKTRISN